MLIILHIAKTKFNNCFIIHLFVLNRYRLPIIVDSFADNSQTIFCRLRDCAI
jgi:hypothetical protein